MQKSNGIVLGTILPPLQPQHVRITGPELSHFCLLAGLTGLGKTELQRAIFTQLCNQRRGVCWIEPHNDGSIKEIKYLIHTGFFERPNAFDELVYIDWGSGVTEFNILQGKSYVSHKTIALNVLESFMRAFPELREQAS